MRRTTPIQRAHQLGMELHQTLSSRQRRDLTPRTSSLCRHRLPPHPSPFQLMIDPNAFTPYVLLFLLSRKIVYFIAILSTRCHPATAPHNSFSPIDRDRFSWGIRRAPYVCNARMNTSCMLSFYLYCCAYSSICVCRSFLSCSRY